MTINELGDLMQADLIIIRYANQDNRWMCRFEHSETKDGVALVGTFANGENPGESIMNYIEEIKGKILVIDAMGEKRREFSIPDTLTG